MLMNLRTESLFLVEDKTSEFSMLLVQLVSFQNIKFQKKLCQRSRNSNSGVIIFSSFVPTPLAPENRKNKTKQNSDYGCWAGFNFIFSTFFNIWSLNTIANAYEPSNMKPFLDGDKMSEFSLWLIKPVSFQNVKFYREVVNRVTKFEHRRCNYIFFV